jgi:hypothetical protein
MFWYYGMFTKAADVPTCLSFANDSFRKHNLNVFLPPGGGHYTTVGGAADSSVIVQVTCVPQNGNTWGVVTVFSNDNNLAQTTRNNVQSDIQAEPVPVRID